MAAPRGGHLRPPWLYLSVEPEAPRRSRYVDDVTTLARIRAGGDREAFAELIRRHQEAVFRVVRNLLPPRAAAECEDVAQDVFLSAYARLDSFDPARGA